MRNAEGQALSVHHRRLEIITARLGPERMYFTLEDRQSQVWVIGAALR